jgi:hypothetical protein
MKLWLPLFLSLSAVCFSQNAEPLHRHYPLPPRVDPISLAANQWSWTAYQGFAPPLTNDATGALTFEFPVIPDFVVGTDQGSVNYLEAVRAEPLPDGGWLSITLEVIPTGPVVFNYDNEPGNTCIFDAHARPIIDTGGNGQYDRWWSNPIGYDLTTGGTVTLTISLAPDHWSSVFGQLGNANAQAETGFTAALQNVQFLGLTFGGGCFFGHGVSVSGGTAEFRVINFLIL